MNIIPWRQSRTREGTRTTDDFAPLAVMRQEMDSFFERFFRDPWFFRGAGFGLGEAGAGNGDWMPPVDVADNGKEIVVTVEVPGVDPKDIELEASGGTLVVQGRKRETTEENRDGVYYMERRFGSFRRVVELPHGTRFDGPSPGDIKAEYKNGVLTVRVPRSEKGARRIPISSH